MTMDILNPIPVDVDLDSIKKSAHVPAGDEETRVLSLIAAARSVMSPRAAYKAAYIDSKTQDSVTVEGVSFKSKVLAKYFEKVERVFPYVVTIGAGIEDLERSSGDALEKYYLDLIGNAAVVKARDFLKGFLVTRYGLGNLSYLGPGQLQDWPLEEQGRLFGLLGDVESAIGVTLNDSFLMLPRKSLSGIYFPTKTTFFACRLCPREQCPARKAKYEKERVQEYPVFD